MAFPYKLHNKLYNFNLAQKIIISITYIISGILLIRGPIYNSLYHHKRIWLIWLIFTLIAGYIEFLMFTPIKDKK